MEEAIEASEVAEEEERSWAGARGEEWWALDMVDGCMREERNRLTLGEHRSAWMI